MRSRSNLPSMGIVRNPLVQDTLELAHVDRLHAKALELGATDEGAPGPRGDGGFYAGYFRDPDGNKLNAFCMVSSG